MVMSAIIRKARSEARLAEEGIPINPNLPPIEERIRLRSVDEIVDRILALCLVTAKGEGMTDLTRLTTRYNIEGKLSPEERAFIENPAPTEQQRINATWRYEAIGTLLWAAGYIDHLPYPDRVFGAAELIRIVAPLTETEFRQNARLRDSAEILDEADLLYRYHWACVDARIHQREIGLYYGVVYERHYALNWLIGYQDQEWDEVTTDR